MGNLRSLLHGALCVDVDNPVVACVDISSDSGSDVEDRVEDAARAAQETDVDAVGALRRQIGLMSRKISYYRAKANFATEKQNSSGRKSFRILVYSDLGGTSCCLAGRQIRPVTPPDRRRTRASLSNSGCVVF